MYSMASATVCTSETSAARIGSIAAFTPFSVKTSATRRRALTLRWNSEAYDASEFHRSVKALRLVADVFTEKGVKAAIEPIRAAEVSLVHTVADAIEYIESVDHSGVQHINGDVYHMQSEEVNIPRAIIQAGDRLVNLHMADSNRMALGNGSMDLDTIIMAP